MMSSNNHSASNPVDQPVNSSVSMQIPNNNIGISNSNNNVFEFYLPLPNDNRIYRVTYTELNSFEIARRLNNDIDISHIPDSQLSHHQNVQHFIRHQIHQRVQQRVYQPQQQSHYFDTMLNPQVDMMALNSQVHSDNVYNNVNSSNGTTSDNYTNYNENYF
jgi:hypothetical protein